ncbi:MAG: glycosyltransferase family 4 protein, partial [Thermoplasmata archaeon]
SLGMAAYSEYRRHYRGRVDVVLEDMLGGSRVPFFAPVYVREPVITVWHQDHRPIFEHQYPRPLWPLLSLLEKLLLRVHRGCYVLTPSRQSAASFVAKGGAPERVRIYRPGIAPDLLSRGPPPSFGQRVPRIVCLGKIRRYKAAHLAIGVLGQLATSVPDAELSIAGRMGQPEYYSELQRMVVDQGLSSRVHFELEVSEERKVDLLRSSRVLIATAPIEGFGVAVLEAGACGLPVVGTAGVPEDALKEGENGLRVPVGDVDGLARQTRRILTDPTLFAKLSEGGYRMAQGSAWPRSADTLFGILREIFPSAPTNGSRLGAGGSR